LTRNVIAQIVSRLYTAAGRRVTEIELGLWYEALEDLSDEGAIELSKEWVRNVDLSQGVPSVARFRSDLMQRKNRLAVERAANTPALDEPELSPEEQQANIDRIRETLASVKRAPGAESGATA
jgi:hypothetical protein